MNVTLVGSAVSPATIVALDTGLLLRLSVACYLGVPLQVVELTTVSSTTAGVQDVVLAADAAVNVEPGDCAQVGARSGDQSTSTSMSPTSLGLRRLGPSANTTATTACLVVHVCGSGISSSSVSAVLTARLSSLSATSNSSWVSVFIGAAARGAGVPAAALVPVVSVGTPVVSSSSLSDPGPEKGVQPANNGILVGVVAATLVCVVALVAGIIVVRNRKRAPAGRPVGVRPITSIDRDVADVSGQNPMRGLGRSSDGGTAAAVAPRIVVAQSVHPRASVDSSPSRECLASGMNNPLHAAAMSPSSSSTPGRVQRRGAASSGGSAAKVQGKPLAPRSPRDDFYGENPLRKHHRTPQADRRAMYQKGPQSPPSGSSVRPPRAHPDAAMLALDDGDVPAHLNPIHARQYTKGETV